MRIVDALRIKSGDVVTLVGGGGKTTVMFRLAEELTAMGLTVISTMTTKIFVGQMERAPAGVLLREDGALPDDLPALLAEHRHVLVGGRIGPDREKVEGVPPGIVDRLAAARLAGVIVVEGDGSRRLPFKAPAEHEPVVPASTTVLVPLAGLDALGRPLDAEHVHRPQLIAGVAGARPGAPITPEILAQVLSHPQGGAKGLPPGARLVPFLNKADLDMDGGRVAARLLAASEAVDEVLVAAAETEGAIREVWGRVAAIVLAAGEARRYGTLKQVLPWRGVPLVAHVANQAIACADVSDVIITTGAQADLVASAVSSSAPEIKRLRPVLQIPVSDWAAGQSRSVRAGLSAAQSAAGGKLSAALFLLADQPGVTPRLLSALVQRHRETLAPVVAPRYEGKRGNPVLFDRRTFPEFDNLEGDTGARAIIRRHESEIAWVDWPTDEILRDIDTPEDYEARRIGD